MLESITRQHGGQKISHPHLLLLQEGSLLQFPERFAQLLLRIHHDRAVPCDRLLERLTRHQKKSNAVVARLHRDLVTTIEKYERTIVSLRGGRGVRPLHRLRRDLQRSGRVAEFSTSAKHISERMPRGFDGQSLTPARRYGDIEINWIRSDSFHWSLLAPETAADNAHVGPIVVGDLGNFR